MASVRPAAQSWKVLAYKVDGFPLLDRVDEILGLGETFDSTAFQILQRHAFGAAAGSLDGRDQSRRVEAALGDEVAGVFDWIRH